MLAFDQRILFVGYGAVAQCTLPILLEHVAVLPSNITILDFEDRSEEVAQWTKKGVQFVKKRITPSNLASTLGKYLRAGDVLIDLGSGDGRIVITAAKRFGASGLGVEIVPDLVARSREHAERAGVSKRARFAEQDLFKTDLGDATVITMYLLPEVNLQLRPRLLELKPGTRIVSHDWDMGDWRPDRTVTLAVPQKTVGREKLIRKVDAAAPRVLSDITSDIGQLHRHPEVAGP